MVFFNDISNSLHGITECLDHFAFWVGLYTNYSKTELFHSNLSPNEADELSSYGFSIGSLPHQIPLVTSDEQEIKNIRIWAVASRFPISFIHREVTTDLFNHQQHSYLLDFDLYTPKRMRQKDWISLFQILMVRQHWHCRKNKIAWTTVCLPKREGGIGLRSFYDWNRVLCLRFLLAPPLG